MTTRLTLQKVEGSTKGRGETCRQLRHRRQSGTKPAGRRAIGILSILQALTIGDFFYSRVRTSFGCLEKNLQTGTPTNAARTELHNMITFHHANTRGLRAARLSIAHLCVPKTLAIHVSCLFLAVAATDHKHKFSLTRLIHLSYLSDSLTNTHKIYDSRPLYTLRCSTAQSRMDQHKSHLSHNQDQFVLPTERQRQRHRETEKEDKTQVLRTICTTFHNGFMFFCVIVNRHGHNKHSNWNCVGANKPQHMHMCSHIACG